MSQPQRSGEITRQRDVAAGDVTGIYHITLCNLPFGTTWQELKDYTRTACDVDHVEVFRTSTSGWVRVKGRANFDKAWRFLNGGCFNGRSIITSDKNASESIKIKELVDGTLDLAEPNQALTPHYGPPESLVSPVSWQQVSQLKKESSFISDTTRAGLMVVSGQQQEGSYYTRAHVRTCGGGPVMFSESESMASNGEVFDENTPLFYYERTLVRRPYSNLTSWNHEAQDVGTTNSHEPLTGALFQSSDSAYTPTERRQIVVTGLPRKAKADDVTAWICKRMGTEAGRISRIDRPKEHSRTAYIALNSLDCLQTGVEALNSHYRGKKIKANLAKEGITSTDMGSKGSRKPKQKSKPHQSETRTFSTFNPSGAPITSARYEGSTPRAEKSDRSRSVGDVLIVDGSPGYNHGESGVGSKSGS